MKGLNLMKWRDQCLYITAAPVENDLKTWIMQVAGSSDPYHKYQSILEMSPVLNRLVINMIKVKYHVSELQDSCARKINPPVLSIAFEVEQNRLKLQSVP